MHLLASDHMLFQFSALLLNINYMLHFFSVAGLSLRHLAHRLLKSLHSVIQVPLSAIRDILHHIQLLLQLSDRVVCCFTLLELLVLHFKADLLKDEYFRRKLVTLSLHQLHGLDQLVTIFLQLPYDIFIVVEDSGQDSI